MRDKVIEFNTVGQWDIASIEIVTTDEEGNSEVLARERVGGGVKKGEAPIRGGRVVKSYPPSDICGCEQ